MYLERVLAADEQILETAQLHWINFLKQWGFAFLGTMCLMAFLLLALDAPDSYPMPLFVYYLPVFAIGFLGAAVYQWLKNRTTEMVITNRRVVLKRGIISVHTSEIRNVKVETVRLHQGILGRLLGYGDLVFTGTGESHTFFSVVASPAKTKAKFEAIIDGAKN